MEREYLYVFSFRVRQKRGDYQCSRVGTARLGPRATRFQVLDMLMKEVEQEYNTDKIVVLGFSLDLNQVGAN